MYKIVFCVLLLSLTACKTLDTLVGANTQGGVTQHQFGDEKRLYMSPDLLVKNEETWTANRLMLGARWSSNKPDVVTLRIVDSHLFLNQETRMFNLNDSKSTEEKIEKNKSEVNVSVKELNINIDSNQYKLDNSKTKGYIDISISLLNQMIEAKHCTLNIHSTTRGREIIEDSLFSVEEFAPGDDIAKASLKKFLAKVNSI